MVPYLYFIIISIYFLTNSAGCNISIQVTIFLGIWNTFFIGPLKHVSRLFFFLNMKHIVLLEKCKHTFRCMYPPDYSGKPKCFYSDLRRQRRGIIIETAAKGKRSMIHFWEFTHPWKFNVIALALRLDKSF